MTKIMEAIKHRKHLKATSYCTIKNYDTKKWIQSKKIKLVLHTNQGNKNYSSLFRLLRPSILLQSLLSNVA